MDEAARAAFIFSQAVCAMAEIAGMMAHDRAAEANGGGAYTEEAYASVPGRYGLGHNDVILYLRS